MPVHTLQVAQECFMLYTLARNYVRYTDAINRLVGRCVLYFVFAIMGILLFSSLSRYVFDTPVIWGVELAQFVTTAYYMLGGGFALLLHSHARMDVFYSRLSPRRKAGMDAFTVFFLIVFLGFLLYGGISSTVYSIEFHQHRNTAWGPALAPIKIIMVIGVVLTLMQAIAECLKDFYRSRGVVLDGDIPELVLIETNYDNKIHEEDLQPELPGLIAVEGGRA